MISVAAKPIGTAVGRLAIANFLVAHNAKKKKNLDAGIPAEAIGGSLMQTH